VGKGATLDESQSKNKFTNSFIDEESQLGFSITGGGARKMPVFGGGGAAANDGIGESSIMDELSVAGFGGSRSLQGRIVSRRDATGAKRPLEQSVTSKAIS